MASGPPIFITQTNRLNPALNGVALRPSGLGAFAMSDEEYAAMRAAGNMQGGSVEATQAAAKQYAEATGQGGGMNFLSFFTNMFGGGSKSGSDPVAQALANANARSSSAMPYVLASVAVVGLGVVAFIATRK